jgi:transcriptional regulator with XRE-family HTH domain
VQEDKHEEQRKQHRDDQNRQAADLWQRVLRQELQQRKTSRDLFEMHERVIGQKVRQLRIERGWSQADLAARLDEIGWPLHQTNISKMEAGRRPMRFAELCAIAMAYRVPVQSMLSLPVAGEPWSMADMRKRLAQIDELIADAEKRMRDLTSQLVGELAHYELERIRVSEAMNEAAKADDRGELEELSAEDAEALAEDMDPESRQRAIEAMTPEQRASHRNEALEAIQRGDPQRLVSEAFRMHLAGASDKEIGQFVADSMPPGFIEPLRAAAQIVAETLGKRGPSFQDPPKAETVDRLT